jgi:hypothetical protein
VIAGDAKLRGALRVGMYVGGQRVGDGTNGMSETEVITNRERLRDDPPDILLTNYKMLDLLLLRPEDRPLWQHQKADSLRYLVVDELHTFDGAQGAEVACLIRRLRSRLGTPDGGLCCIGTSATLAGDGDSGKERLAQFATNIFGSSFTGKRGCPCRHIWSSVNHIITIAPSRDQRRLLRRLTIRSNYTYNGCQPRGSATFPFLRREASIRRPSGDWSRGPTSSPLCCV